MRAWALWSSLLAAACVSPHAATPPEQRAAVPVRVEAARSEARPLGDEVVGTVRARDVAYVSSSVMGTIQMLKVKLGDPVRKGDVLIRLAAGEIDAKAAQAEAAFTRAKTDLARADKLRESRTIPEAQHEAARTQLALAQAALAEASAVRDYTVIRAPISGVVTAKESNVGDLALPGKPLLVIESPGALRLEAYVPEVSAAGLPIGRALTVRVDALAQELAASVGELSPTADAVSRSVLVKLDLPRAEGLRSGMFGRVSIARGQEQVLTVPAGALVRRGQLETLFVADHGRARLRLVRVGRDLSARAELLAGLEPGEPVIVSHPERLRDGQPVEVRP